MESGALGCRAGSLHRPLPIAAIPYQPSCKDTTLVSFQLVTRGRRVQQEQKAAWRDGRAPISSASGVQSFL